MRPFVFYFIAASGVAALYVVLGILRSTSRRSRRRNPLTRNLLRSPGHTVRNEIDELSLDILSDASIIMVAFCLAALGFSVVDQQGGTASAHGVLAIAFSLLLIFFITRLVRNIQRRHRLRLALDAEMATGEELNQLMLSGCRVFHDFPADRFNIDHVVVGPRGVLAVETKARAKPVRGRGREDARVTYDGNLLLFPTWQEREPLEQASRQAVWLGKWLTSAVGEPVTVHAAVALPGWYVDGKGAAPPIVFNPRNAPFPAERAGDRQLSGALIQRIAHQIEQRCRDVMPQAFRDPEHH